MQKVLTLFLSNLLNLLQCVALDKAIETLRVQQKPNSLAQCPGQLPKGAEAEGNPLTVCAGSETDTS